MRPEEHERQAAAFLAWHRKAGRPFDEDFVQWAASKDLWPADAARIRRIALAELVAAGEVMPTHDDVLEMA